MDKKTMEPSEEQIETSNEAVVLADAIFAGLSLIAEEIKSLRKVMYEENNEEREDGISNEVYLDGSKVK